MSSRIHPLLRALATQAAAFLLLALLALAFAGRLRLPAGLWIAAQALLAALLGRLWGLRGGWLSFQVCLPPALAWQAGHAAPAWLYPLLLALLLLVYGGGLLTRVPLYHSNRAAWAQLLELLPERADCRVVDLGAGFGGPLAHLARHRPEGRFLGVEASPLPWLVAWLRRWPLRRNCRVRLGSLWSQDLAPFDLAFAFLSPAPMARLWTKALGEMRPGSLLVSHSFEVPGASPERRVPLPGRAGACLLIYRIPARVKGIAPQPKS